MLIQKIFKSKDDAIKFTRRKRLTEGENFKIFDSKNIGEYRVLYTPKNYDILSSKIECLDNKKRNKNQFLDYINNILEIEPEKWTEIEINELINQGLVITLDKVQRFDKAMYRISKDSVNILSNKETIPACQILELLNDNRQELTFRTFRYFYEADNGKQGARFYQVFVPGFWVTEYVIDVDYIKKEVYNKEKLNFLLV